MHRKEYARLFSRSLTSIAIAQTGRSNALSTDPYEYITPEHLPPDLDTYMRQYLADSSEQVLDAQLSNGVRCSKPFTTEAMNRRVIWSRPICASENWSKLLPS